MIYALSEHRVMWKVPLGVALLEADKCHPMQSQRPSRCALIVPTYLRSLAAKLRRAAWFKSHIWALFPPVPEKAERDSLPLPSWGHLRCALSGSFVPAMCLRPTVSSSPPLSLSLLPALLIVTMGHYRKQHREVTRRDYPVQASFFFGINASKCYSINCRSIW